MPLLGPLPLRGIDARRLSPQEKAGRIENMVGATDGALRSFRGFAPYQPAVALDVNGFPDPPDFFGVCRGVCHALLNDGQRDLLLVWDDDSVRVHQGWTPGWGDGGLVTGNDCLIGPSTRSPIREVELPTIESAAPPPQWVVTDQHVIIIPQAGRAYITDGDCVLPLGYDRRPSPPSGVGPVTVASANDFGYNWSGENAHAEMGYGRVGSVEPYPGVSGYVDTAGTPTNFEAPGHAGILLESHFQAVTQWVDQFGNLSPLSERSAPLIISAEDTDEDGDGSHIRIDDLPKFVGWDNVARGPEGTVGRILFTTRDVYRSGDVALYEVPSSIAGGGDAFATMHDNVCEFLPYNMRPGWLGGKPLEPIPVPEFRAGAWSGGRLWITGIVGDPSAFRWTVKGKTGTFVAAAVHRATSGRGTAIFGVAQGTMLFTTRSVTLAVEEPQQMAFRVVADGVGTPAPSSVAQRPDGSVCWFGGEDFYVWDGQSVQPVGAEIRDLLKRANRGRWAQAFACVDPETGDYICVVPVGSAQAGGTAFVYSMDGSWRTHPGIVGRQFCVTQDHRKLILMAGRVTGAYRSGTAVQASSTTHNGVWLWDKRNYSFDYGDVTSRVETGWLTAGDVRSEWRKIRLWLLETDSTALDISVYRDYRIDTDVNPTTLVPQSVDDDETSGPPSWDSALVGAFSWAKLRPFLRSVDFYVEGAEAVKIDVARTASTPWYFLGMTVEYDVQGIDERDQ